MFPLGHPAFAVAALMLAFSGAPAANAAGSADIPDYEFLPVPNVQLRPGQPASPVPKFLYMFGQPAKWPGVYAWRYNPDNAPASYIDTNATVSAISASFRKWSASCNIAFRYEGVTAVRPNTRVQSPAFGEQPDFLNVIGWETLSGPTAGVTYAWYADGTGGPAILVDSDIILNPSYLTTGFALDRTATHEYGHAIGLAHSNVNAALMSGPPDSSYNSLLDPQADDVHGCRCLYGPAAGHYAGYVCSLPRSVDFGLAPIGTQVTQTVPVANNGNLALTISSAAPDSATFQRMDGCPSGTVLAPGQSCTLTLAARPPGSGSFAGLLVMQTSDGEYRVPLNVTGATLAATNYTGLWWSAPARSESGWGINIAHNADTMFVTWFTYDATGKGWWLVMTANKIAEGVYSGDFFQTRGPPFSAVPFDRNAVTDQRVGSGVLNFGGPAGPVFSYTINGISQVKNIVRQEFGPLPSCVFGAQPNLALATNYTDLWWAAPAGSESGWGINFTHQGDTIFATWFTYDTDGSPMWLVVTANRTGTATFAGKLYRTTGPAFSAIPFDPDRVAAVEVGDATFTFANGNSAAFAYTVYGVAQSKSITREVLVAPGTVCN